MLVGINMGPLGEVAIILIALIGKCTESTESAEEQRTQWIQQEMVPPLVHALMQGLPPSPNPSPDPSPNPSPSPSPSPIPNGYTSSPATLLVSPKLDLTLSLTLSPRRRSDWMPGRNRNGSTRTGASIGFQKWIICSSLQTSTAPRRYVGTRWPHGRGHQGPFGCSPEATWMNT